MCQKPKMEFHELPVDVIEKILSYLSYDEIAKIRSVSTDINAICQGMLNRGFKKVGRRRNIIAKRIKAQLPVSKVERKCHHLTLMFDVLVLTGSTISMLKMTYSNFVLLGLCCFIPGKLLDQIQCVLDIVEGTKHLTLPLIQILQELQSVSILAMDHFKINMEPIYFAQLIKNKGKFMINETALVNLSF